jgi:hypothetical protein
MINDFIIPIIFIGIGIWLKSIKQKESSGFEKWWWVFVIIGIARITLKLIGISMQ